MGELTAKFKLVDDTYYCRSCGGACKSEQSKVFGGWLTELVQCPTCGERYKMPGSLTVIETEMRDGAC